MTQNLYTINNWLQAYRNEQLDPTAALLALRQSIASNLHNDPAWISLVSETHLLEQLSQLHTLSHAAPADYPLYGVPFVVKDNIDVAGMQTTAACPTYAYWPDQSAAVVQRLQAAGAIVMGKSNLDQFATGLVGTRSPYGAVPNVFNSQYVSGGSSSGSASIVARGIVPFALGTDTAGSGRVPAGFNNIVGLKPTPGTIPMRGVVPACRSLDVVSIFSLTAEDAATVLHHIQGLEQGESALQQPRLRPAWFGNGRRALRVGVPSRPECDPAIAYDQAYASALERLEKQGVETIQIDTTVLHQVADLLYNGPWVAERYAAIKAFIEEHPDKMDTTVRKVIERAKEFNAEQAFSARYRLAQLSVQAEAIWQSVDFLMVPTSTSCPTLQAVQAAPIERNSELGRYTNFVNLLGWAALAMPSSISASGLPFGVTFIAPGGADSALASWARNWEAKLARNPGLNLALNTPVQSGGGAMPKSQASIELAVVGAHLEGLALHYQIEERGCRFLKRTQTAAKYRLYALPGSTPPKPGMVRDEAHGGAIEVEVYEMPSDQVGSFLALIPYPLGLGSVELADGRWVKGFVCEAAAVANAKEITQHGAWRKYLEAHTANPASEETGGTENIEQQVKKAFYAYETALMANDVAALDTFFWQDPRVTRYGIADRQWGIDALRSFRAQSPTPQFTRELEHLRISTFDLHTAVAQVEFIRSDTSLRGFQTQVWRKFGSDWRIVAAHVSMIPWPL